MLNATLPAAAAEFSSRPDLETLAAWLDVGQAQWVMPWLDSLRAAADVPAQLVLVRALRQLGADRAGDALALCLGRAHPTDPAAVLSMLRVVHGNQGSYAFWRLAQGKAPADDASLVDRAGWLSLRGCWLAGVRDDTAAMASQRQALALCADDPWLWVEHSYALARIDRLDDAHDAARQALRLCPGYRTGMLQTARLLQTLGRLDEARALLEEGWRACGSAAYAWSLHGLAQDAQQHEQALALLDQVESALPMADKGWLPMLAARRADALLHLGRVDEARQHAARVSPTGFYAELAQRLASLPPAELAEAAQQRAVIPLAMVAQYWMTCAPATLTALAGHWGRPADHLEVAQAICYDGTPQASERAWAVAQGFWVRECKLDWPTACALLHAGVPFALATRHAGGGHLQAVVGHDTLRRTLLVRDPSLALHAEYEAAKLFDAQQAGGPRAMVMLPPEEVHRLDGLVLPEALEWDHGHELLAALQRHDRPTAVQALAALQSLAPEGDNTLRAQRFLAVYDGDEPRILAATEALLARYPEDRSLQLSRLSSLYEVQGQAAGDAWLADLVSRPHPDPVLLARWAARLGQDGRRMPQALALVRRALRRDGQCGRAWSELSDLLWARHGSATGAAVATEPARIASTLLATEEWAATNYARACRVSGRAEDGLAWLRERERIWGDRSSQPALTLVEELSVLQRDVEAEALLKQALQRRPADMPLRLAMAERALYANRLDDAEALLAGCSDAHAPARLRLQAMLAEARGQLTQALACAQEAATLAPMHLPHQRLLLRLLRRQHGHARALALWRPNADAHPAHVGLQQLLYDALPDEPQTVWDQLERMQATHPGLPWLQRERATQAARAGRLDEAVTLAEAALALTPENTTAHDVLAYCVQRRDGYEAALPHLRAVLCRDVEVESALYRLLQAPNPEAQLAATDLVASQMRQQVLLGDSLLTFQAEAGRAWPAAQVLAFLAEQRARWPALWQGTVAMARQLMQMQRLEEALAELVAAAERFPLLPRVHFEQAEALRLAGRIDDAVLVNAKTLALSPAWNRAVRLQIDLLCKHQLRWDDAETLLQRALMTSSGWADADLIGLLAWVHEGQDRSADALAITRRSLALDPSVDWVWALLGRLCDRAETPAVFDEVIDEVVASRPGDAAAWLVRAERSRDDHAALQAAEQALALQPRLEAAWHARFERLLRLGRLDELAAAQGQLPWPAPAPLALRAWGPRVAWVRGTRDEAVIAQRALCDEAPHDETLRVRLADWLDELDDHTGYLGQATALVASAPLEARSHGYHGHALVKLKRWAEALAPLQRALELAPGYTFAARQLTIAAREGQAPDLAEPALQALWLHLNDVATACDGIELAVAARQPDRAQAWLQRLFDAEGFDIDRTRAALRTWREAGWADRLVPLQRAQVMRGGGPVGLVIDWLDRHEAQGLGAGTFIGCWRVVRHALALQAGARQPHLLLGLMRWLGDREKRFALGWVLRRCEASLRADDLSWGEASYALCRLKEYPATARWLHDWRQRERPPAYALANLAGSLAVMRRWPELDEVVDHTLQRQPAQEDMRLWQLLAWARHDDLPALEAGLTRLHEWSPDPWMNNAILALQAYLALAQARASGGTIAALLATVPHRGGPPQARALWRELRRRAMLRHTPWTRLAEWFRAC